MVSSKLSLVVAVLLAFLAVSYALSTENRNFLKLGSAGYGLNDDRVYQYPTSGIYRFLQSRQGLQKRNNAEVVNHILKNFGTLDRLGDVGK
ncbi:unnamed protein product [Auanema sp. JU1783]|nr:unnamed protein product [Auanema sp. JU1783]